MAKADTKLGELNPPEEFGNYVLLERLGFGPVLEEYRAKMSGIEGFERHVLLRRLRADVAEDGDTVRTFIDDAKRASALQHANIAQVIDLGKAQGCYYVAAQFVDGPSLKELVERAARQARSVPLPITCHVAIRILEGLEYAHNRTDEAGQPLELLHSGIAAADVGVSGDGHVKLLRFSALSLLRSAHSGPEVDSDRLGYMSPEQVRGLALDRRSDTFAVGIILHELMTGRRLFSGDTDFETLERVRKVEVTPPSLLNPDVPAELEEIVLRALSRQPQGRYQTAGHMARDLQRFVFQAELYASEADLRSFVHELFPESYGATEGGAEGAAASPDNALDWDEEEVATAVFGRHDQAMISRPPKPPSTDAEIGEWSRDLATGTHERSHSASGASVAVPDLGDPRLPGAEVRGDRSTVDDLAADLAVPSGQVPAVTVPRSPDASSGDEPTVDDILAPTPLDPEPAIEELSFDDLASPAVLPPPHPTSAPPLPAAPRKRPPPMVWAIGAGVLLVAVALLIFGGGESPTQAIRVSLSPPNLQYALELDGQTVHEGAVPHAIEGVAPGTYELTARAPGYEAHTETVEVEEGVDLVLNWQLHAVRQVTIPFRSTPPGATVVIDGEPRGTTPVEVPLPVGQRVRLELTLDGHSTHTTGFVVSERASAVTIAMSPDPAAAPVDTGTVDPPSDGGSEAEVTAEAEDEAIDETEGPTDEAPAIDEDDEDDEDEARDESDPEPVADAPAERTEARGSAPEPEQRADEREAERRAEAERQARLDAERREREERRRAEAEAAEAEAAPTAADGPPGFLNVQSVPDATVFINGENVGQTPLRGIPLAPGRHRVELVNEDADVERSYRISIESGRARTIVNRTR